ncbi:MAG: nucleotide sugar dehydrogenase [Gemmatimonadetes bacterium]|nr:nucleotide sugar dehydrogenase [Gemmatimonadota bacterium]
MTAYDELTERIRGGSAQMGILGLGYVGLPLATAFCEAGYRVIGYDVDPEKVERLRQGESYLRDVPTEDVRRWVGAGLLEPAADPERLHVADALHICVPTPLNKTGDPDVSYLMEAAERVRQVLRPGHLVALESTTYPGTTRELLLPRLESTGLRVGEDFFLVFSPERVDPGNTRWNLRNTPKVVGGITARCTDIARLLYERIVDRVVVVTSTEAAELTKLLENMFRSVNIALVNEMAIVCDRLGVDVWEVIEAAATKPFGFMRFLPGPGLGGHCIPVDPHYLAWRMRALHYKTRFVELASEINSEMPKFWVDKVLDVLNQRGMAARGARVLILGVAYKPEVEDTRESPALDIVRLLEARGAVVEYHDPYVPLLRDGERALSSVELTEESVAAADVVVIVTDHARVDYDLVARAARAIVDTRNALARRRARRPAAEVPAAVEAPASGVRGAR